MIVTRRDGIWFGNFRWRADEMKSGRGQSEIPNKRQNQNRLRFHDSNIPVLWTPILCFRSEKKSSFAEITRSSMGEKFNVKTQGREVLEILSAAVNFATWFLRAFALNLRVWI